MRRRNWLLRLGNALRLSTKATSWRPLENTLSDVLAINDPSLNVDDYSQSPVRVQVKKNVRSLGYVEQWKKRRSVYICDEKTSLELSQNILPESGITDYEEGSYKERNVPVEKRINYQKQSFERDISLLAVRWFQRRRGTELKRQFYRHRHTIYASCCHGRDSQELKKEWLERLNIPESAFEVLSSEEQKDWFSSEVCRRLFTKRYSVALAAQHSVILYRRLRSEVAKLGRIDDLFVENNSNSCKEMDRLEFTSFNREKDAPDIIILDDTHFSDANSIYSILEFAIRSLADYGLLCVHVDLPKLSEELQSLPFASEFQLRRFLDELIKSAFIHRSYLEPVFSCILEGSRAHLWLRVRKDLYGPVGWTRRSGLLYYCPHCYSYRTQPLEWTPAERQDCYGRTKWSKLCEYCGTSSWLFGGTVYLDSLCHARESSRILHELVAPVSQSLNKPKATLTLANAADMELLFSTMAAESTCSPFFLNIERMNELFQVSSPGKEPLYSALKSRGYQAFPSHTSLVGLKTNAPLDVVWDLWKSWKLYCEPTSHHYLLSHKPLLYFHSKEWDQWLSSPCRTQEQMLAISNDERLFHRLHNPKERMETRLYRKQVS